ncbi:MAG TPA: M20/M25/M40 family metallo-hydrolase [Allosphingosinicella sp.]|nr:M20/M25/M40 family metallo-hydrolase [Allosphingosinicella sp.]
MGRATWLFIGGLFALLAAFALKHALIAIPAAPETAEPGTFDTNRAFARLERILAGEPPHPVDSPGSDLVRDRLLAEMRSVGLQSRVSDEMVCNNVRQGRNMACARVRNLAATIGPAEGEHLLIVAHYDSVPVGPGAADAGIAIATMLEVAEQLRDKPLARPVTFLFNEGEESGLLGARSFLERDPAAPRVSHLINLEARGVDGPAIMFETSRPNAAAVSFYDSAVDRPVANSLSTDFYRLLPNLTDVSVLEERPWTILNIAIIGNETRYHTAGDNLASLDRRSLQHMGSQALQLATRYTAGEVPAAGGELVYMDLLTRDLVALPLTIALVLLGLTVLLFGYALIRRRAFGRPLLACAAAILGAALLAWAATSLIQLIRPGEFWRAYPLATHMLVAACALLAAVTALTLARQASRDQLRAASWFFFALVGAGICFLAPGAAIYFLLAPLAALFGILLERWRPGSERIAGSIAAVLQLLTLLPIIALMELLLSTSPGWVVAPLFAAASLPLLIELRPDGGAGRPVLLAALAATTAALAAALLVPAYSGDRQQIFTVEHVRDFATRQAQWGIYSDGAPLPGAYDGYGEWTRAAVRYARRARWLTDTTFEEGPAPQLVKVAEQPAEGGRRVTLRLVMNGWDGAVLNLPASASAKALIAGGISRPFGAGTGAGDYSLRCTGRSCDGFTFDLLLGSTAPVDGTLIGNVARLPASAAPLVAARPELARPQYVPDASYALVPVRF